MELVHSHQFSVDVTARETFNKKVTTFLVEAINLEESFGSPQFFYMKGEL
jgi:hypothetical protein